MVDKEFDAKKFIEKELRRAFKRCPQFTESLRRAKEEYFVESKHGKQMRRVRFTCATCGRKFINKSGAREIAVDHRVPVVDPAVGFVDFNTYIDRLLCPIDNLQILCNYAGVRDGVKSCHKIKTAQERAIQAERQRKKK